MNRQAVYHSIKSNYSFPVSDNELVIRLRVAKGDAQKVELIHSMKYDWTIRRECCAMRKEYSDGLFDYFIVKMCLQDTETLSKTQEEIRKTEKEMEQLRENIRFESGFRKFLLWLTPALLVVQTIVLAISLL